MIAPITVEPLVLPSTVSEPVAGRTDAVNLNEHPDPVAAGSVTAAPAAWFSKNVSLHCVLEFGVHVDPQATIPPPPAGAMATSAVPPPGLLTVAPLVKFTGVVPVTVCVPSVTVMLPPPPPVPAPHWAT